MRTKILTIGIGIAAGAALLLVGRDTLSGPPLPPPPPGQPPITPPMPPQAKPDGIYVAASDSVALAAAQQAIILKVPLPAGGIYEISGKVVVTNDSQDNQISIACALSTGPSAEDTTIDYSSITVAPQSRVPITLLGTYRYPLTIGTPVMYIACRSSAAGASARWSKLIATPVSKIN